MTYLPENKIPKWMHETSKYCAYSYMFSVYSLIAIMALILFGIIEFNIVYFIFFIITSFISLMVVISIETKRYPEGW